MKEKFPESKTITNISQHIDSCLTDLFKQFPPLNCLLNF